MSIVVFAGPTVRDVEMEEFSVLDFRPPAECGDVAKATHSGASAIGLIDGVFHSVPSVWHKEILLALRMGVPVFGAGSIGALRAAECSPFGMIGFGKIYWEYQSGKREADADVAVTYTPKEFGYAPLSLALVDVEATLVNAYQSKALHWFEVNQIYEAARVLHFSLRNWRHIIDNCSFSPSTKGRLLDCVGLYQMSQKAVDAVLLLSELVKFARGELPLPAIPEFSFNRTVFLNALEDRLGIPR